MRIIKISVSSLFCEMMNERDLLHRQVAYLLENRLGKDSDVQLRFVDLRRGMDSR